MIIIIPQQNLFCHVNATLSLRLPYISLSTTALTHRVYHIYRALRPIDLCHLHNSGIYSFQEKAPLQ